MADITYKLQDGIQNVRNYLRDVVAELKKVSWPSKEETISKTKITIVVILLIAIIIALIDFPLLRLTTLLFGK